MKHDHVKNTAKQTASKTIVVREKVNVWVRKQTEISKLIEKKQIL